MLNQIITCNAPPAQGKTVRGDSANNKNGTPGNEPAADAFSAVLARQIDDKKSALAENLPLLSTTPEIAPAVASRKLETSTPLTDPQAQLPAMSTDAASAALAAMLQVKPEIKVPQASAGVAESAIRPADNTVQLGAISEKTSPSTGQPLRTEITMQADLKNLSGTESFKAPKLPAELPVAAPSEQALAQMVSSSVRPDAMTKTAVNTIAAPVGSSAWPDEFSQKISWVSTQQNQTAELHLNPPDLGPMKVVISVTDNQATALFTSPHSAVREAIENALPKLRESFADNGIMLGNATVSDQPPRDNNASNFMNSRSNQRADADTGVSSSASAATVTPLISARRHNGMVDTFA